MKKLIVDIKTRELLMALELGSEDPKVWAKALKSYSWDREIELIDCGEILVKEYEAAPDASGFVAKTKNFWNATKSWLSSFISNESE